MTFWRLADDGVSISVKVQPKYRRPGLQGSAASASGDRLRIGVSEAPENGRANRAVCELVARALQLPSSSVSVAVGVSSREKILRVIGDGAAITARLAALDVPHP